MNDADLLIELASIDEIEAHIPTNREHVQEAVPSWCDLVLKVRRHGEWPITLAAPLRRHDGELISQVLKDVLHPKHNAGAEAGMWHELDAVVDRIQARVERGKEPKKRDLGQALGLATAIALVNNPVEPDVDDVRATAMERWESRQ